MSSKTNVINGWTSKDLRHLPLLYTQPATSFLKFCSTPPSIQSLIVIDSYMLTDRQVNKCVNLFVSMYINSHLFLGFLSERL